MSVAVGPELSWDELFRAWQEIDVPRNWRAEIVDGEIVVTPPPDMPHHRIASLVHETLVLGRLDGYGVHQTIGVAVPLARGGYIPDLCVIPWNQLPDGGQFAPVEALTLAVEITSKRYADRDRKAKKWGYAHGGVPLYLLIDRFDDDGPTASLFSSPVAGTYRNTFTVPFGEPITLPKPFDLDIPTDGF